VATGPLGTALTDAERNALGNRRDDLRAQHRAHERTASSNSRSPALREDKQVISIRKYVTGSFTLTVTDEGGVNVLYVFPAGSKGIADFQYSASSTSTSCSPQTQIYPDVRYYPNSPSGRRRPRWRRRSADELRTAISSGLIFTSPRAVQATRRTRSTRRTSASVAVPDGGTLILMGGDASTEAGVNIGARSLNAFGFSGQKVSGGQTPKLPTLTYAITTGTQRLAFRNISVALVHSGTAASLSGFYFEFCPTVTLTAGGDASPVSWVGDVDCTFSGSGGAATFVGGTIAGYVANGGGAVSATGSKITNDITSTSSVTLVGSCTFGGALSITAPTINDRPRLALQRDSCGRHLLDDGSLARPDGHAVRHRHGERHRHGDDDAAVGPRPPTHVHARQRCACRRQRADQHQRSEDHWLGRPHRWHRPRYQGLRGRHCRRAQGQDSGRRGRHSEPGDALGHRPDDRRRHAQHHRPACPAHRADHGDAKRPLGRSIGCVDSPGRLRHRLGRRSVLRARHGRHGERR
jgi:hypothetical protein